MSEDLESQIVTALEQHRARGVYPVPERELSTYVAARVSERKGFATRFRVALRSVAYRERPRLRAAWAVVLASDAELLFGIDDQEIATAVASLRRAAIYPAPFARIATALSLTGKGKDALRTRLMRDAAPAGISVLRLGSKRELKLVRRGEEDFARALTKAEVLQLRLQLADLEAGASAHPPDFRATFDHAYDALARELHTQFVPLPRLRAELGVARDQFDHGVIALCQQDAYQLAEHEHPSRLTHEERAAGLAFGARATLFHYVSKV